MGDDRNAPPITLTDPHHPGPLHDVLASDEQRVWHPSRRQLAVLSVVVLVVAAAATPYLVLRENRIRTDRLVAAASVTLLDASDGDRGRTTTPPTFTLTNEGGEPLRLVSATLDDYPAVELDETLVEGDRYELTVPLPEQCPAIVPDARPGVLAVTFELSGRGKTVPLDVHGTSASYEFRRALQARCLLYAVQEAVTGEAFQLARAERTLRLQVELVNVGPQETRVRRFQFVDGFRVVTSRPALPQPVPPAASFADTGRVRFVVDVAVSGCDAAEGFVSTYQSSYLPPMQAVLVDGAEEFFVELDFTGAPILDDARAVVAATC